MIIKIIVSLLYVHQTLDVIGVKGYVDRPEKISPDTIGWSLLTFVFILYWLNVDVAQYILIILFGLVLIGFYYFHWKHYFFGTSQKKIDSYNEYFKGTHRILAESSERLVPDTFHIVHTLIYIIAFISLIIGAFI